MQQNRSGLSFPHQLWLRKETILELRVLTDAVEPEVNNLLKNAINPEKTNEIL
jgi:hypothetical protein